MPDIFSYSFLVVAIGTMCLGVASGMIGLLSIFKGQSLIGDTIGHAAYPGVVLAFMIFLTREPSILMLGSVVSGALAYLMIVIISNFSSLKLNNALALVLSSSFGLGMVFKSYVQGNPAYSKASQSGLQSYIFGQAAYMMKADVYLIMGVSLLAILLLIIFYKEIKVFVFDPDYAFSIGISRGLMNTIILLMTLMLISVGLKVVGAILISALLIIPGIIASLWSRNFLTVLIIAGLSSAVGVFIGNIVSSMGSGYSTGPVIVVVLSIIAFISMLISPRGVFRKGRN